MQPAKHWNRRKRSSGIRHVLFVTNTFNSKRQSLLAVFTGDTKAAASTLTRFQKSAKICVCELTIEPAILVRTLRPQFTTHTLTLFVASSIFFSSSAVSFFFLASSWNRERINCSHVFRIGYSCTSAAAEHTIFTPTHRLAAPLTQRRRSRRRGRRC